MDLIKEVNQCRLCDSADIDIIWDLGLNPLPNAYKNKEDLDKKEFQAPLVYFKCGKCHSVQLKHEISPELLFLDYSYESPPNLIPHFKELAKTTSEFLSFKENDLVIDIGSSNGRLLQEYKNLGYKTLGIEPARNIVKKAWDNGIETLNRFFSPELALTLKSTIAPKAILSTNCFAHIPNLNEFIEGIKILLPKDSYFIFENAYLLNSLDNKDLGQLYFEHVYLHNLTSLQIFFQKHGLNLFNVEYNNVQMGSIRGYVGWEENRNFHYEVSPIIRGYNYECYKGLNSLKPYKDFINNIDKTKSILLDKLKNLKLGGKSISVYGWPAKMTVLNKYFDLEPYIDYIIEESSLKTGKYAPGTKLEIKNLDYFKENPTDVCILGAYNFEKDIKSKNSWFKGQWINPMKI